MASASGGAFRVTTTSVIGGGGRRVCAEADAAPTPAAATTARRRTTRCRGRSSYAEPRSGRGYNARPRGCGGIGRRARFRSVWGKPRGGSSPLIRIASSSIRGVRSGAQTNSARHKRSPLNATNTRPKTPSMTREEALAILAGGDFDGFVGVTEGLEVEFKREPYRMGQDSQKFELAKDVSALANAGGGVIVIGVLAERGDEVALDVVTEVPL